MAQGYKTGLWIVTFQVNWYGLSELVACTSDRGCGWVNRWDPTYNPNANDQFLAGASVTADGYWISYYTLKTTGYYLNLITQAIYFPTGNPPIGATVNDTTAADPIFAYDWLDRHADRCPGVTQCYAAGDFQQISSISFMTALTPYVHKLRQSMNLNDLTQNFVTDPPTAMGLPNFTPNHVQIKRGDNLTAVARPVPKECYGPPPGHRHD